MKTKTSIHILFFFVILSAQNDCFAQFTKSWSTVLPSFNGSNIGTATAGADAPQIKLDGDGRIYTLTNLCHGFGCPYSSFNVNKLNSSGTILWTDTFSYDVGKNIISNLLVDPTGKIYANGSFYNNDYNFRPTNSVKYNTSGNQQWVATTYENNDYFPVMQFDNTGNIVVSGTTHLPAGWNVCITQYSASGSLLWQTIIPDSNINGYQRETLLATDNDGNSYVTYLMQPPHSAMQTKLYKFDNAGNLLFTKFLYYDSAQSASNKDFKFNPVNNSLYLSYYKSLRNHLMKINLDGSIAWDNSISTNLVDYLKFKFDYEGNCFYPSANVGTGVILTKYDSQGNLIYQFTVTGSATGYSNIGIGFAVDLSNNLYIIATQTSLHYLRITKYDPNGNIVSDLSDPTTSGGEYYDAVFNNGGSLYILQGGINYFSTYGVTVYRYTPCTLPTVSISAGGSTTFCAGDKVKLTATSSNHTYQWQKDGVDISGSTKKTYTANGSGSYTCSSTNSCGNSYSTPIIVTVNPLPTARIKTASPQNICQGETVTLTAKTGSGYSYQWQLNTVDISGATIKTFDASEAGSYTVVVTASTGCSKTSKPCIVNITCKDALSDNIVTMFSIYPNPSTDGFQLQINSENDEEITVNIKDVSGRMWQQFQNLTSNTLTFGNELPTGIYFVEVVKASGERLTQKLVKIE